MTLLGFTGRSERNAREIAIRSRIESQRKKLYEKQLNKEADYRARRELGLLKKKELAEMRRRKEANSYSRGLRKELDRIRNTVQSNQQTNQRQVQDVRQSVVVQNRPVNFFEHRSEQEVYGDDEGLTFFDSKKRGGNGSTGEMFGF